MRVRQSALPRRASDGGMMPAVASLRRPSEVIQSLTQAGSSWTRMVMPPKPACSSRLLMSALISHTAGRLPPAG